MALCYSPHMEIPEAAIEAVANEIREEALETLLAALPALREQMRRNFEAGLRDPSEGLTVGTIDDVLRIFDEELGDSHAQD